MFDNAANQLSDDSILTAQVEIIDDPSVIGNCCASALARRKLLVCCRCENADEAIVAIVVFPIELKHGHPFCGRCFRRFAIWNRA